MLTGSVRPKGVMILEDPVPSRASRNDVSWSERPVLLYESLSDHDSRLSKAFSRSTRHRWSGLSVDFASSMQASSVWNGSMHVLPGRNPNWTDEKYPAARSVYVSRLLTILVIIFIEDSRSERGREFSRDCLPGFGMRSRSALRYCFGRLVHLRQALVRAVSAAIVTCGQ